ncbi:hypothetical protein G7Y89_g8929 [Cudoniella acicularis]|uniref:Major facilitator superfamily (MFS) profile domain-containing protein n=1 Tax=Cudoniella acicularis TaxID=354080 RepID=A0A8H4W332_9HELO|nr:hypothetical protein G7Y89_g8929 [Cudoniella acicularis]
MSSSNGTSDSHDVIDEKPEAQVISSENDLATSNKEKPDVVGSVSDDKNLAGSEIATVEEDESKYLSGQKRALLAISLALVVFIVGLDGTIVSTAAPTISNHFNSLKDVGWYGSAFCSFQLFWGKIYNVLTAKASFLSAICIFEIGSLLAGVAPTSSCFIVGRAISGIGVSGIVSGAILIIADTVPLHQRPIYMAIVGGMEAISSVVGPLIGGALTTHASWRWCFYISLPVGGLAILLVMAFYRPQKANPSFQDFRKKAQDIDWLGIGIFIPAIICLILALQWGGTQYSWANVRIIVLLILFGLLLIIFIYIQIRRQELATLPPHIVRQRSMAFGLIFAFCGASVLSIIDFYLPIWFQAIKGVSAFQSAVMTLPIIISLVVGGVISAPAISFFGYYKPFMILGCILTSFGTGFLTTFKPWTGHSKWIAYQVLAGLGSGMSFQQPLLAAQVVLGEEDLSIGTAAVILAQNLGSAVSISIAQSIFTNKLVKELEEIPSVNPKVVQDAGATNLREAVSAQSLPSVILAYDKALTDSYYLATAFATLMIVGAVGIEWRSVKEKKDADTSKNTVPENSAMNATLT